MQKIILPTLVLFSVLFTSAQREKKSWQDYLSYSRATKIALAPSGEKSWREIAIR